MYMPGMITLTKHKISNTSCFTSLRTVIMQSIKSNKKASFMLFVYLAYYLKTDAFFLDCYIVHIEYLTVESTAIEEALTEIDPY